jgi:hypothetical protein
VPSASDRPPSGVRVVEVATHVFAPMAGSVLDPLTRPVPSQARGRCGREGGAVRSRPNVREHLLSGAVQRPAGQMTPEELFLAWGAAWVSRDDRDQVRRLLACCTEDVVFIPPTDDRAVVRGRRDLIEHVGAYTADWPQGTTARLVRPPDTHHDWSRGLVEWVFPTSSAVGCDIIRIADGKIATMLVFAEPAP